MKTKEKNLAKKYRIQGFSLSQISNKLYISKSTASIWLKNIKPSVPIERIKRNRHKYLKKMQQRSLWGEKQIEKHRFSAFDYRLICSILYWGEGAKTGNRVEFTNSDPKMIKLFLKSLKIGFKTNLKNIKANLHLHKYHSEKTQLEFWSKITKIPLKNFNKTYWKPNSNKIIRKNYPGCIRICYYSKELVDKIKSIYLALGP